MNGNGSLRGEVFTVLRLGTLTVLLAACLATVAIRVTSSDSAMTTSNETRAIMTVSRDRYAQVPARSMCSLEETSAASRSPMAEVPPGEEWSRVARSNATAASTRRDGSS